MGEPPLRGSLWTQGPSGGSAVPWGAAWCFVHATKRSIHGRSSSEGVFRDARPWWGLNSAQGGQRGALCMQARAQFMAEPPLRGSPQPQDPGGGSAVLRGSVWCFVHMRKSSVHGRTSCEGVSLDTRPRWGLSIAQGLSMALHAHEQELNS